MDKSRDLEKAALRGEPSYVWRAGQQRRLEMILEAAGGRAGGNLLENGCGVGMYVEHLAPCNAWCPAGSDVIGFIQTLLHEGAPAAAEVLRRTQPLASICGRVCPSPCMEGCNRRHHDGAVNIRSLERWIGDHAEIAPRAVRAAKRKWVDA